MEAIDRIINDLKGRIFVVLNPGHASDTPGKRSPDGRLMEWVWNMAAAEVTARLLEENGYIVSIERAEKETVSLTYPVRKTNEKCEILGNDNVLFISLHCNAAQGNGWVNAKGWEIWTTKGETESDVLAECIYQAAGEVMKGRKLRYDTTDGDHDKEADYYVLRKTKCPAALIESGFMNDKEGCEYLLSVKSKWDTANTVLNGLEKYLKLRAEKKVRNLIYNNRA